MVIGKYQVHMLDLFNLLSMISNDRLVFSEPQLGSLADARMMIHDTEVIEEAGIPLYRISSSHNFVI